ncbi:hypothetical protein ACJJTC_001953 [Scirpophaga incertulas]
MAKKRNSKSKSEDDSYISTSSHSISSDESNSDYLRTIFIVLAVLCGLLSYYTYQCLTTPPPLPEINLYQWWGQYPIDRKAENTIKPFKIEFSNTVVKDLKERLFHRRPLVEPLINTGFSYGLNNNFLVQVLDYWHNQYNFKERENYLNSYQHYKTNIQGLDIHYMHIKTKSTPGVEVLPLLMLHGWPGSFREFYDIIPKLVTPNPKHEFVFEIIVPSLPGFGYSQAPARPGFGPLEAAIVMRNLMRRLGHERYYVQGGDASHGIGSIMATVFPGDVLGFHTNMPIVPFHILGPILTVLGSVWPRLVIEPQYEYRMYPLHYHFYRYLEETGYLHIQATKPDTVGIALTDSPAGLAAYILEKYSTWTNPEFNMIVDGRLLEKYQPTQLLDILTIYWATNSITTSMRLYAETFNTRHLSLKLDNIPTDVPTWGIKFKHELFFTPDFILRCKYRNYLQSTYVTEGGQFAALEMPETLAKDIFQAVAAFRTFWIKQQPLTLTSEESTTKRTIYDFSVTDLNGNVVKLEKYRGQVLLIVNVASQCGLTETNYYELNELHDKYAKLGLRILAFPCNQFGGQEPGTSTDIMKFTKHKGVMFDVFSKINVNGEYAHPLFEFLKSALPGTLGDFIKWNFTKFVVDRSGVPVERFSPSTNPSELEEHLLKYLRHYAQK